MISHPSIFSTISSFSLPAAFHSGTPQYANGGRGNPLSSINLIVSSIMEFNSDRFIYLPSLYYFHTSLCFVHVSHYITVFLLFIVHFNHIIVILFAYILSFFLFCTKKRTVLVLFYVCFLIDFLYSLGVTPIAFLKTFVK